MKKLIISGAVILVSMHCGSNVNVKLANDRLANIKKVALLATIAEKPTSPLFPLMDAGIFNGKFHGITADIDKATQDNIDQYRENVAKKLESELGMTVVYGVALAKTKEYQAITKEGLQDFPVANYKDKFSVIQASAEKNYFNAEKGEFVSYFDKADMAKHAAYFCEKLKVDGIAFSVSQMAVINAGMFGISGDAILRTNIIVYDKSGTQVLLGSAATEPAVSVNGGNAAEFAALLAATNQARPIDAIFAKIREGKAAK